MAFKGETESLEATITDSERIKAKTLFRNEASFANAGYRDQQPKKRLI